MTSARLLRICAAVQGRVDAVLLGFAAAILVGLAGTARTLVIWLWHKVRPPLVRFFIFRQLERDSQ
jgi:hypothetical protein